ncbi:MAG: hypothetical protein C0494_12110 [Sphingobium sp.]|nr:hypothetical protein [Sphingobium sp.]
MTPIKLLFVEDEADIRTIVEKAVALDPFIEIRTFCSGVEALAALEQYGDPFDIALVNLRLPHMSGIEFHEHMRMMPGYEHVVTTLITAMVRDNEVAAYNRAGITGVIAKPFNAVTLAAELRRIYERHALKNQPSNRENRQSL